MFTPEELAEMAAADAEIEAEFRLTQEDLDRSYKLDREVKFRALPMEKQKLAARQKAYREANREKVAAQKKAYYEANREKVAEYQKAYREANREKVAEYQKAYREANREKVRERARNYMRAYRTKKRAAAGAGTPTTAKK
jgi:hypothetical protein